MRPEYCGEQDSVLPGAGDDTYRRIHTKDAASSNAIPLNDRNHCRLLLDITPGFDC
jgi:hypothetical protein